MSEIASIATIEAAAARLKGRARVTPLLSSPFLDEIAGRPLYAKAEVLQHTGSFKFRGAWSALSALPPDLRAQGVVAFSSGNHAQGVARAAQIMGVPAVIVMPEDAPELKVANTRAFGAEVVTYDRAGRQSREEIGARLQAERGLTLIRPYDDAMVVSGQGTCGLEIARQAADRGVTEASVIACCGGGGLTAGIALALEATAPGMRVHPAEPEGFDDTARSLAAGSIQANTGPEKGVWDAILTPAPGEVTFPILNRLCGPGIVVSEDETYEAMRLAATRLKLVVEPGGAVALAAALFHGDALADGPVICTLSGGNADPGLHARVMAGMAA